MEASAEHEPRLHPSAVEHVVAVIVTLLILEQHSRLPEATFFVVVMAAITLIGLGIAYFSRLIREPRRRTEVAETKRRVLFHWLVFPLAVTLMLTSAATHWPATIRFYLSKSSFDELVAEAYNGQAPQGFPRWVGLYWVDYVQDSDFDYETRHGTIGFVTGVALIDECGIYYDETDHKSSHYLTTRIAPNWYVTEW